MLTGLFDVYDRLAKIDRNGDPLVQLNQLIDWSQFRPLLEPARPPVPVGAGRRPYDAVLLFKMLVLQSLYNLSDDATEAQVLDRLSFMRFVGVGLGDRVPDAKTLWLFREALAAAAVTERLFAQFDTFLRQHGFAARKGQIVDATLVAVPRQRNTRDENAQITAGTPITAWSDAKRAQKDVDARWTKKHGRSYFGYKNHVSVDVQHKLIRRYAVTDASTHDSQRFAAVLDPTNTSADVWADAAYQAQQRVADLTAAGYRPHLQRKGVRGRALTAWEQRGNRTRAKIRARVEHVFGHQRQRAGTLLVRTIGRWRAAVKIGLRNLVYNLDRYCVLRTA